MQTRYMIELGMTVALVLYLCAFRVARVNWGLHVALALAGFSADFAATVLMTQIRLADHSSLWSAPTPVILHVCLSSLALFLFFIVGAWGLQAKTAKREGDAKQYLSCRARHVFWMRWIFLPTWGLAFASGFMLYRQ